MTMIAKVKKNPTDPIAIIVGGIIEILAILGVPEQLGLDATQVAQLGGAAIMIAGSVRFMLTKHEDETPAAQDSSPEPEEASEEAPAADPEADKDTVTAPPPKDPEAPQESGDKDEKPTVPPPPSVG